jgi:hypothetical protein
MSKNNHMEPYKITLDGWVDQVLEHSLIKKYQVWIYGHMYMAF